MTLAYEIERHKKIWIAEAMNKKEESYIKKLYSKVKSVEEISYLLDLKLNRIKSVFHLA